MVVFAFQVINDIPCHIKQGMHLGPWTRSKDEKEDTSISMETALEVSGLSEVAVDIDFGHFRSQ